MNLESDSSPYLCRQDINNFPFFYKLWLVVNSETCDFIKWNIDGTGIELKIVALDAYLHSSSSIFKIKNRSLFVDHLGSYGFRGSECFAVYKENNIGQPVEWPAYSEFVMKFQHEHFLRHRIDLLGKIRKIYDICILPSESVKEKEQRKFKAHRNEGDLCFTSYGALSQIQKSRIKCQIVLNLQSERKILKEKLLESELKSRAKGLVDEEEDSMIELPAELFENPHDSVLYMGDEHRTAYAGYYGNCDEVEITKFFGDYLPMYENANDNAEGERRIVDLNPSAKLPMPTSTQPINFEINYTLDDASPREQENTAPQLLPTPPPTSSSLQPIFAADNNDYEEDISMDEFITFNKQTTNSQPIPSAIKDEVPIEEDDIENEANFKNFFRQYRESLSLLYDKQ